MVAVAAGVWVGLMWIVAGAVGGHLLPQQTTSATVTTLPAYPTGAASKRECFCVFFPNRRCPAIQAFFRHSPKKKLKLELKKLKTLEFKIPIRPIVGKSKLGHLTEHILSV